jgi:cell wall assembly regulator SMI1
VVANAMSSLGERLRSYWRAQGAKLPGGVPAGRVEQFESRHGVRLPDDLREYFLSIDGMGPEDVNPPFFWDEDLFRFFPLHEVERATNRFHPDRFLAQQSSYFAFADRSISLPTFVIRLTPEATGHYVILAIFSDRREYRVSLVADSFGEFVERYLASRESRFGLISGEPSKSSSGWPAVLTSRADLSHPLWDRTLDG